MYRACKYDFPSGFGLRALQAKASASALRIKPQTDVRTFKCADYQSWETGLLPFSTPEQGEIPVVSAAAENLPNPNSPR